MHLTHMPSGNIETAASIGGTQMCCNDLNDFMRRFTMIGICMIGSLVAPSAFAGAGSNDGTYSGVGTVTFGTQPVCGPGGDISITVNDNRIDYKFGDFPLKFSVAEDGSLHYIVRAGKQGRRTLRLTGKIADVRLEANLRTRDFTGHLCSYHWSLNKN
jgi:hypothetical protein